VATIHELLLLMNCRYQNKHKMRSYEKYRHQSLRLKDYNYSSPGEYYVTICTKDKINLFGEIKNGEMVLSENGEIVERYWLEISKHFPFVELDVFQIMPNHLHGVIRIIGYENNVNDNVATIHELSLREIMKKRRKMLIPKTIGWFKMNSAKEINSILGQKENPVWQKDYYEHIIRNGKELENILNYIHDNPANWENDEENIKI